MFFFYNLWVYLHFVVLFLYRALTPVLLIFLHIFAYSVTWFIIFGLVKRDKIVIIYYQFN